MVARVAMAAVTPAAGHGGYGGVPYAMRTETMLLFACKAKHACASHILASSTCRSVVLESIRGLVGDAEQAQEDTPLRSRARKSLIFVLVDVSRVWGCIS